MNRTHLFANGGETGAMMDAIDWAATPLGPVDSWPQSLCTLVPVMLASRFAMRIIWGPELILLYNDSYRAILGPDKHPGAMAKPMEQMYAEVWSTVGPLFRRVLAGEAVGLEDMLLNLVRNGYVEEAYFTLSYSPLFDDAGAIAGLLGVVHESTERVLAERRLLSLRELAAAAAQGKTIEQACWLTAGALQKNSADVPFALLYLCDDAGEHAHLAAQVGLDSRDDAAPATLPLDETGIWPLTPSTTDLVLEDVPTRFATIRAGAHQELVNQAVVIRLPRRGHSVPYGFLIAGANPRRALDDDYYAFFELASEHIVTAISNSLAHSETEEARNRLQQQFMQAPVAVSLVVGPNFLYEMANPRYEEMVNRTGLVGRTMYEVFPELEHDAPTFQMLREVMRTGVPFQADEYGVPLQRNGVLENVYFQFTSQPMREVDGQISGILTVAVDVTAQVVARRERQELLAREQGIRAEAEIANRAKDEFLAMLGHELRNPLAPILTALQLMRLRGDESLERERAIIERQVGHVIRLVDDLLDVSRITRGHIELKRERVELAEIVAKAMEMASPLIEQKQHRLSVSVPRSGLVVDGDSVRLAQIVSNLLTNAAKYTEARGEIHLSATASDDHIELRVRDTGIGLTKEMRARVFEPFVQERQASDRAQGGLGLGLAIVRSFAELHGGTVEAKSEGPGRGSEFLLRLPRASGTAKVERRGEARGAAIGTPATVKRVLVVDDNIDAAELLSESLRAMGYITDVAHDGPSALQHATRTAPDIALLDIGLPAMDGYELARHLRTDHPTLRLIALTGYGQASDRERSLAAGFDAHLVKPIHLGELRRVIERLARTPSP